MTLRDYISSKLASLGASPSEADFVDMALTLDITEEATEATIAEAEKAIALLIPQLIARPDVSEGGFSMRMNRQALSEYYSSLCKKHGLYNQLVKRVTFL